MPFLYLLRQFAKQLDIKITTVNTMGVYLAQPNTQKNIVSKECPHQRIKFTLCEMQGWRREMEDAAICETDIGNGNALFAVFDGHGGPEVSIFVRDIFISTLISTKEYESGNYAQALFETFQLVDLEIASQEGENQLTQSTTLRRRSKTTGCINSSPRQRKISDHVGCTAHVLLITPQYYIVANSGDSRGVLCRNSKCFCLSYDHKPQLGNELERIINAGGTVEGGRINSRLNLSRSLGDFEYKKNADLAPHQQMVICHPDVRTFVRSPQDKFVLLGCDGVFEKYCNHEQPLVTQIRKKLKKGEHAEQILSDLFDHILAPNTKEILGCDNMTGILIQFL